MFLKIGALKNFVIFTGKHPTQVFSCKCCEIFKNIYFEEHLRTAASVIDRFLYMPLVFAKNLYEKQVATCKIINWALYNCQKVLGSNGGASSSLHIM